MKKEELNIVYMGTPDFAVPGLHALLKAGYNIAGVITATDEICPNRVRFELGINRNGGSPQCLRDDLATVEATPRITRPFTDMDIGPMR